MFNQEKQYIAEKVYIQSSWVYNESYKRSILGFSGFIFQFSLLVTIMLFVILKSPESDEYYHIINSLIIPFAVVVPLGIYFWFMWYWESRKLRKYVTAMLNEYGDIHNFEIPKISPFNMRRIPEIALALVVQGIILIFFVAIH